MWQNRIKQNLYNKGINRSTINEAVSESDKDTEFENAMYLAKRYERVKKEDKKKIYQKFLNIFPIKALIMILLKEF